MLFRSVERLPLGAALPQADCVMLALPLAPGTQHLVNAATIAQARPDTLWVNVGRGSVVDEAAMADALAEGRAGGYAADVFACEDWARRDRPDSVPAALRARSATCFTPHLGSAVQRVRLAIEHRAADNILAVLGGGVPPDAVVQAASKADTTTRAGDSTAVSSASSAR